MSKNNFALYEKYHAGRADERYGMFQAVAEHFEINRVLYPGSFVHVTPSFVFPDVVYVDAEKRGKQFFAVPETALLVAERKSYPQDAQFQFHHQDYSKQLPESDESFDLLISQYAGFISQHCKRYLKIGGWLLTNNSHGDAGMANLDDAYEFVAVVKRRNEKFTLSTEKLEEYFTPKKEVLITKAYLEELGRGIGYQKSAFGYVFCRTG